MPAAIVSDPIAALVTLFKADSNIAALCGTRVYGQDLPPTEAAYMPRTALVIQSTGGAPGPGRSRQYNPQVDVRAYGSSPSEAHQLMLTANLVLQELNRVVVGQAIIYGAVMQTSSFFGIENKTLWPFFFSVWQINSSFQSML